MKKIMIFLLLCLGVALLSSLSGLYMGSTADMSIQKPEINFNYITQNARLDVLTAQVNILEDVTIGDAESPDYKRVYSQKGIVVYSIDLSKVVPYTASNGLKKIIFVPLSGLDATLYIDESTTEKLAEYQKGKFTGSAKDGFRAYLDTAKASFEEMERAIKDYSSLYSMAEKEAINQVRMLVEETVIGDNISVEVFFSERRSDDE